MYISICTYNAYNYKSIYIDKDYNLILINYFFI